MANVNSLSELKRQLKEVKAEALSLGEGAAGYDKLIAKAGILQYKMGDVNDQIKQMASTSDLERLSNTFGDIGTKVANLDFEGASESMSRFTSMVKSIDFSKLIAGAKAFGVQMVTVAGEMILAMGPIAWIITGIGLAIAAIGAAAWKTSKDVSESVDKQIKAYDKLQEKITERYDVEIKLAKARGDETDRIEIEKATRIRDNANLEIHFLEKVQASWVGLTEEQQKRFDELKKQSRGLDTDILAGYLTLTKKAEDETKKNIEKADKAKEAIAAALKKANEENEKEQKESNERILKDKEESHKIELKLLEELRKSTAMVNQAIADDEEKKRKEKEKAEYDASEKEIDIIKRNQSARKGLLNIELNDNKTSLDRKIQIIREGAEKEIQTTNATETEKILIRQKAEEEIDKLVKEKNDKRNANIIAGINSVASSITTVLSAVSDFNQAKADEAVKVNEDALNQQLDTLNTSRDAELAKEGLTADQKDAINKKYAQQKYALELQEYNQNTAIKKKAFEQDKKMKIAMAVISTITGAIAAVTGMISSIPGPVGIILGAIAGAAVTAAGVLQIAKIKNTKFEAGEAPSPPSLSAPSTPSMGESSTPATPSFDRFASAGQGQANNQGQNNTTQTINVKAFVSGQEITNAQDMNQYSNNIGSL